MDGPVTDTGARRTTVSPAVAGVVLVGIAAVAAVGVVIAVHHHGHARSSASTSASAPAPTQTDQRSAQIANGLAPYPVVVGPNGITLGSGPTRVVVHTSFASQATANWLLANTDRLRAAVEHGTVTLVLEPQVTLDTNGSNANFDATNAVACTAQIYPRSLLDYVYDLERHVPSNGESWAQGALAGLVSPGMAVLPGGADRRTRLTSCIDSGANAAWVTTTDDANSANLDFPTVTVDGTQIPVTANLDQYLQ